MRRSRFIEVIFIAVASLAVTLGAAPAANVRNAFRVSNWSGGAYFDDQTKAFDRCAAALSSAEGTSVSYSVDRDYRWRVTLSNPAWNFVKGSTQGVSLKIGDVDTMSATATALDKSTLNIETRDQLVFFARLRVARQLRIVMGGLLLGFSLDGGEETLSALTQCVLRSTRYSPNAKSISTIFEDHKTNEARAKEAGAIVTKIIEYARVAGSQVLPTGETFSFLPADAAWKVGLVVAGLTILDMPLPKERVAEAAVAHTLKDCRGGFFFNSQADELNKVPVERVFVSCQTIDTTTSGFSLIVPRPQAGSYVLTVVSTGSAFVGVAHKAASEYEAKLRSITILAIQTH